LSDQGNTRILPVPNTGFFILMKFDNTPAFARKMDRQDPLRSFRSRFLIPRIDKRESIYFTGNSLGLQPRTTKTFIQEELEDWKNLGVEGHVHSRRPWLYYHKFSKKALAAITGAKPSEVVAMNQLTVNLHLMLVSFYRPTPERYKIITEAGAFSSDQYAFESQLRFHGVDPAKGLIEMKPRDGEYTLRTDDILNTIREHGSTTALVILGGVQYYTGQFFDIRRITQAAHAVNAYAGFDLAHAIGNVPLQLHKHEVDFAVWCSYKYLNSGPGAIAGAFVHEKHATDFSIPRFAGWWGHQEGERFQMRKGFKPMPGVDGWQLSNFPILPGAALLASLEIYQEAGMRALRTKSVMLTGYLEYLLKNIESYGTRFMILTPEDPDQRGCQLSIYVNEGGKKIFNALTKNGIIADWREPNVIRVAPVPLYNSFQDVFTFAQVFRKACEKK
jgi:kynureninase